MRYACFAVTLLSVIFVAASAALADGVYFVVTGEAQTVDLTQTRQEVLLASYRSSGEEDYVTYVLQARYSGSPSAFAWVIPTPATPTGVVAHASSALFDELDRFTKPRFEIYELGSSGSGLGCTCAGGMLGAGNKADQQGELVVVEATGQAGIFEWAALTSTGSAALLTWLNTNNYAVPASADTTLDGYIQQGMHFLALRINQPSQASQSGDGQIAIPPIQYTCQTSQLFYPMVISQISAASQTEVLVYVLGSHRTEAANVTNAEIESSELVYDSTSASLTNYETVFTQTIADNSGLALITEYAQRYPDTQYTYDSSTGDYTAADGKLDTYWPDAPSAALDLTFLTRMRTVIAPSNMTVDFTFQDATSDSTVSPEFWVQSFSATSTASMFGPSLGVLLAFGLFRSVLRRRGRD